MCVYFESKLKYCVYNIVSVFAAHVNESSSFSNALLHEQAS